MYVLTQILGSFSQGGMDVSGEKEWCHWRGEENVVCNLSELRLGFGLIQRTLSLLSGLEFPRCNFHIVLGKALQ